MRHAVFGQKLSRDLNARKSLINNLASSVLENGQIMTTRSKAKFAQRYIEKLITSARKNKLNTNRLLDAKLSKKAFLKLIGEIGPGFSSRSGGYTRIVKLARRRGDAAPMAKLTLLKFEKISQKPKVGKSKKPIKKVISTKIAAKRKQASKK